MGGITARLLLILIIAVQNGCSPWPVSNKTGTSTSSSASTGVKRCLDTMAGGPVMSTADHCDIPIAGQIAGVDCSRVLALPASILGATGDATATTTPASIPIVHGNCRLSATGVGQVSRMYTKDPALDVVALVDFTSTSTGEALFGLDVRCTLNACVGTKLRTPGDLLVVEGRTQPIQTQTLYQESYRFVANRQYRLVVVALGDQIRSWINGVALGSFTTSVSTAGFVTVSVLNRTAPSGITVDVQRFYAFKPS